ncbi:MAG: type I glutamate--ammonia ligase [Phycisphaerae bacterium]|nr:type I glutamate--ammonia ligase [Phycisphaerae bacterium]
MFTSVADALKYIKDHKIALVDLKIVSLGGRWLHLTIPAREFSEAHFDEGVGYDGSSGSGFSKVESGDVSAVPRVETGFLDPFWDQPTISFLCDTITADTKEPFLSDPRTVARRAVDYMRSTGIADEAWMGPEFEFHLLDRVEVVNEPYYTTVDISCSETESDGVTPPIPHKGGYLRVPPSEHYHDVRSEIVLILEEVGIPVRYHHHEVGAPGQCEIEVKLAPLVRAADQAMLTKYVIKNIARRHGKLATFMPKPIFGEAGNGMHVHQKLTKDGRPLFYDERRRNYADLSDLALQYVAGLLRHGRGLTGLTNPSTNSFKRLVEGYEAPMNLFFSLANRSAAIRVPKYATSPEQKRIEYRPPDFTGNVYLTLAAMLLAGLDGIQTKLDLAAENFGPFDVDIAKQSSDFRSKIAALPTSLHDAAAALRQDHDYLLKGDVFSASFIQGWVESKIEDEARAVKIRPHPYEYQLYLDV